MKKPVGVKFLIYTMFMLGASLAACDAPAGEQGGDTGSDLPRIEGKSPQSRIETEAVVGNGSTDPDSPGGEAVTEQEIPQSDVPPPSRAVFSDATCDFESWVGKKIDNAAIEATGRPSRILEPGAMMTMDHSPQRINIEHDKDMVVTRVWCG